MKKFIAGFMFGLLVFLMSNVISHFNNSSPVGRTDRVLVYGFPFWFWIEGGLPQIEGQLDVWALFGDLVTALSFGTFVGILVWKKSKRGAA